MKRAQRTDLVREMKKSFNRYISILAIMALGVAFYAGVRSSEPDMQLSAKQYFDETNYMDVRVLGTLGMTDDDVKEIGAIDGVAMAEGGYQTELFLEAGQRDYQMSVYSMGDALNQVYVTEGRVPEAANECFVDRDFMSSCGYKIGDTITLRTDKDTELSDVLAVDTFTIVGAGIFPNYLSWQRGSVSIGTGVEDGFLFLPKEAFSMEVYTVVYATVEGAKALNPYAEEYEAYIDEVIERIEAIADARCEVRYAEVTDPYWEDIREAEAEIADGEKELADGEKELADAEQELADAEIEIADAEKKIADGEVEIADGEKELADAEAEIKDGEQKLADAEKELADALAEIEDGERQLADAEKELADALAEIKDGEQQIADGEKELADALAEIKDGEQQIADGEKELADALAEIKDGEQKLADAEKELADALSEIKDGEQQIADGEKELADALAEIQDGEAQISDAEQEIAAGEWELYWAERTIADNEAKIAGAEKEIEAGEQELAAGEAALAVAKEQLAAGKNELEAGKTALAQKEAEFNAAKELLDANGLPLTPELLAAEAEILAAKQLLAGKEAELSAGEQQLAVSETELVAGRNELEAAKQEVEAGKKQITAAKNELWYAGWQLSDARTELESAKTELENGRKQYEDGLAELEQAKLDLADGKKQYEEGLAEVEQAKLDLADGKKQYEEGLAELEQAKLDLADGKKQYEEGLAELEQAKLDLADGKKQYEDGLAEYEQAKLDLADGKKQYEDGLAEYEQAKLDLADGKKQYEDGLAELEQAKLDLEDGKKELADAKKKVEDARVEIADAKTEIADGKKELEDGKKELADAKAELEDVEVPEWYVLDRETVQQFVEYGSNTERVGNLGDVFPAVFYLVAALVSLTTMTRMIEEERTQIGTMKALGYGKGAIVSKYLWYSLSATLLGGVLGIVVGSYLFPWVIMKAYGILYTNIPYILTPIQWGVSGISVAIAVVCTVVATMSSCYKEMVAAPAILMRPVAPPAGRRVFLEYVKPVWNALNFSWKATCRNLFRYKKRFFMTIFGIGGCMALLLVGFGLRDSIMDIVNKQYAEVWTYDAYLSINDEAVSLEEKMQADDIKNHMFIHTKTMDVGSDENVVSSTLFVPERLEDLEDFVVLQDRVSGEKYRLTEENTIITEKLAKLLDVSVGDTIELNFDDVTRYQVTVDAIAENYMFHYVYLSAEKYEQLCTEVPEYNQLYLKTVAMSEEEKEAFSGKMLSDDGVDSVTYVEELQESVAVMMKSLELVIVVLIVAAGMLAFIVLYNLNNINIIERRRELATLKVLGFYDMEVANYVYRENVLLTILGAAAGVIMGLFLHRFVIMTVEIDMMMFGRDIEALSFVYSIVLTFVFAIFINIGMFYKLRKIDMATSLKSAE